MPNHTPGPWTLADCRHQKGGQIRVVGREYRIANVFASGDRAEADAHLIAGAPDLLAALREVLPYLETGETEGDDGADLAPKVRSAIARATIGEG